jgi:hypothetical protein
LTPLASLEPPEYAAGVVARSTVTCYVHRHKIS